MPLLNVATFDDFESPMELNVVQCGAPVNNENVVAEKGGNSSPSCWLCWPEGLTGNLLRRDGPCFRDGPK